MIYVNNWSATLTGVPFFKLLEEALKMNGMYFLHKHGTIIHFAPLWFQVFICFIFSLLISFFFFFNTESLVFSSIMGNLNAFLPCWPLSNDVGSTLILRLVFPVCPFHAGYYCELFPLSVLVIVCSVLLQIPRLFAIVGLSAPSFTILIEMRVLC